MFSIFQALLIFPMQSYVFSAIWQAEIWGTEHKNNPGGQNLV